MDIRELVVGDIMKKPVQSVDDASRLNDAVRKMDQQWFSLLPVVDNQGCLVGVLSTTDLLGRFCEVQSDISAFHVANEHLRDVLLDSLTKTGQNSTVKDVMQTQVHTTTADTNLIEAAQKMLADGVHHLPVVDDANRPVGMLAALDFVNWFATNGKTLAC